MLKWTVFALLAFTFNICNCEKYLLIKLQSRFSADDDGKSLEIDFTDEKGVKVEKYSPCKSPDILSCKRIDLRLDKLRKCRTIRFPDGTKMRRIRDANVNKGRHSTLTFEGRNGATATLTLSSDVNGVVTSEKGVKFSIEPCSRTHNCHLWIKEDDKIFQRKDDDTVKVKNDRKLGYRSLKRTPPDNKKIAKISLMVYYTARFAEITKDIRGFVDNAVDLANAANKASKVYIRYYVHCVEKARGLKESPDLGVNFNKFKSFKKSDKKLKNSADVAILFTAGGDKCGQAFLNTFSKAIGVVKKSCVPYYSFTHEIAHTFGAMHGPAKANNYFANGNLFHRGTSRRSGFRTIMAYPASHYMKRINAFSGPKVSFKGRTTGDQRHYNNVRILNEKRFRMAKEGNEKKKCNV